MNRIQVVFLVLVLVSAAAVVAVRHQNRLSFVELQKQERRNNDLQAEWGRLMIERATWTRQYNVADDAKRRLDMAAPAADRIVTLRLEESNDPTR